MAEATNGSYETTDLGIAAALASGGVPFKGIGLEAASGRYPRGRVIFQFDQPELARTKLQDYYGRRLQVDAQTLLSTLRDFRALIFNKEQLGGGP
jgi:hypothetical protein